MSELRTQRIKPASQGLNTEAAPDYLDEEQAPVVQNLLPRPGKLVMRGPIRDTIASASGTPKTRLEGTITFGDEAVVCLQTDAAAYFALHINAKTQVRTALATTEAQVPGLRTSARIGTRSYTFSRGSTKNMISYTGGVALPTALTTAVAPAGGVDITTHLERLWVLGATGPGGTGGGDDTLIWSAPGGLRTSPAAGDWKDNVSGLLNQIVIGTDDDGRLMGFGKAGRELVVFRRKAIYIVYGQTVSSLAVRKITSEFGCVSRDTIVNIRDGCYFLADQGYMYFDGAQITNASNPNMRSELVSIVRQLDTRVFSDAVDLPQEAGTQHTAYFSATDLGTGAIVLSMGVSTDSPSSDNWSYTSLLAWMYDVDRQVWTSLVSGLGVRGHLFKVSNRPAIFNDAEFLFLDELTIPEALKDSLRGRDSRNGVDQTAIVALWSSRLQRLASPGERSQLQRLLFDYKFVRDGQASGNGWRVSLRDGSNNVLLPATDVPAQADPPTQLYRYRASLDCFAEANDAQLTVSWDPGASPPALAAAEIYDTTLEFQVTRRRPPG